MLKIDSKFKSETVFSLPRNDKTRMPQKFGSIRHEICELRVYQMSGGFSTRKGDKQCVKENNCE